MVGVFTTILVNACFLLILLFTMGVVEPHPETVSIALEIEPDEQEIPKPVRRVVTPPSPDRQPQAVTPKPQVSTSSSARPDVVEPKPTAPSMVDEVGDVDVPENPKPTDNRSIYQSNDNGTLTAQTVGRDPRADYADNSQGQGNDRDGDAPKADVKGRWVAGGKDGLFVPKNTSNKEGRVVVEITVNQSGAVITAKATTKGSTVQDATLWKAAEDAAKKTTFNIDYKANAVQTGTITYNFRLR